MYNPGFYRNIQYQCSVCLVKRWLMCSSYFYFFSCFFQDTLRDCAHETSTCYNTVVSPIYFVSFVLTAQFVLVNVVIAVLMKHLEESNKEAKEEAELEAELELESRALAEDMAPRSPQLNPLALGMDRSSSGGSPWRSTGGLDRERERDGPRDSPTADITRADPTACLEPPLEVQIFLCCLYLTDVKQLNIDCCQGIKHKINHNHKSLHLSC